MHHDGSSSVNSVHAGSPTRLHDGSAAVASAWSRKHIVNFWHRCTSPGTALPVARTLVTRTRTARSEQNWRDFTHFN